MDNTDRDFRKEFGVYKKPAWDTYNTEVDIVWVKDMLDALDKTREERDNLKKALQEVMDDIEAYGEEEYKGENKEPPADFGKITEFVSAGGHHQ